MKVPSHWARPVIELEKGDSLELDKDCGSSKEAAQVHDSPQIQNELSRSCDVSIAPNAPSVSRLPAFVPWKKYNIRPHTHAVWNALDMESLLLFNADENISQSMDNSSNLILCPEILTNVTAVDSKSPNESPQAETAEEWKSALFDQFGVVDLSRMPPRVFLAVIKARASIREEIRGILAIDSAGIPLGKLVWLNDEDVSKLPKVRTTLEVKLKANGVFKSRICLRGDTMSVIHQQFVSSPTARKEYLRLFCSIFVNIASMIWLQVDISKAFLQSDYLHPRDKVVALLPEYVG